MALAALQPRESAVDACARALRGAVLAGDFAAGARLPPERSLAASFAVNRVTVRAALAQLVREGLLTVRQGSGYQVRDWLASGGPPLVLELARGARGAELTAVVRDLLEVRRGLARVVLERLARKKPAKAAVARVGKAVDRLEALVGEGASARALAQADLEVLGAVVAATQSEVLRLMLNPVAGVLLGLEPLARAMFAAPAENVAGWRLFIEWLEAPSPATVDVGVAALAALDEATLRALRREGR